MLTAVNWARLGPMVDGLTHRQIVEEVFGILVRSIVEGDCYVALAFAVRNPNTPVENAAQMGPRYAGCVGAHRFLVAIASRTVVYLAVGRCAVVCSDTTPAGTVCLASRLRLVMNCLSNKPTLLQNNTSLLHSCHVRVHIGRLHCFF